MNSISANLNVMIKASEKASKGIIRDFGEIEKLQVSVKGPSDYVSNADKKAEKIIIAELEKAKKKFSILSEEIGSKLKNDKDNVWIVDPIDGTRSYVIGNPTWSKLIALNFKGIPILGLANFPILKKYYFNETDKFAFVCENGNKKRLKVNKKVTFANMKLSAAFHGSLSLNQQKKIPQILKRMQFPCADALSYSHFAEGKIDIVIQCGNKIWDIHALIPIIRAAGGVVTTWKNEDAKKAGNIICAPNKKLHKRIVKILKPVAK